jgi:hypothetical protein
MKKRKLLLTLFFSLFVSTCFYSCDKQGQLEGTIWQSSYFQDANYEWAFRKIAIYFPSGINYASITILSMDSDLLGSTSASYTCKGNKITLTVGAIPNHQTWEGKISKNTMTLDNVFGRTLEFKK